MPTTYQEYLACADAARANGALNEACEWLERAYELKQTRHVNQQLVMLLADQGHYAAALGYCEEYWHDYLSEGPLLRQLVTVLLGSHAYVRARQVVQSSPLPELERHALSETIHQAEANYAFVAKAQIRDIQNELRSRVDQWGPTEQQQVKQLPFAQWVEIVQLILVAPELSQFVRASYLEELQKCGVTQSVRFRQLDGSLQTVTPVACPTIREQTAVLFWQDQLAEEEALADEARQLIQEQLFLAAAAFYPQLTVEEPLAQALYSYMKGLLTGLEPNPEFFDQTTHAQITGFEQELAQLWAR